jgi:hypothetical protein
LKGWLEAWNDPNTHNTDKSFYCKHGMMTAKSPEKKSLVARKKNWQRVRWTLMSPAFEDLLGKKELHSESNLEELFTLTGFNIESVLKTIGIKMTFLRALFHDHIKKKQESQGVNNASLQENQLINKT